MRSIAFGMAMAGAIGKHYIFVALVMSSFVLVALLVFSIVQPAWCLWPAPQPNDPAWRFRLLVHRASGVLIALTGLGALGLAVLDRSSLGLSAPPRWLLGSGLLIFGATFGLSGYIQLGVARSQGVPGPLEARGAYRYSRNPQYVGAIGVLLGFGLLSGSKLGLLAGTACSVWFLTAPFAEEPWLHRHLGSRYDEYLRTTPRFLGLPKQGKESE